MATDKKDLGPTCEICGKPITSNSALEIGRGHRCDDLLEKGWTAEALALHRQELSADKVEDNWVSVPVMGNICRGENIPISALVRAMGGDRAVDEPLHENFRPTYVGRTRYLNPWCATIEGLNFLRGVAKTARKTEKKSKTGIDEMEKMEKERATVEAAAKPAGKATKKLAAVLASTDTTS